MGILRLSAGAVACLGLASTGCVQKEFQDTKAQSIMTGPVHLEPEQVMLTSNQVDCGVQHDLWEQPTVGLVGGPVAERTIARLLPAGKALHFDDDVVVTEPGSNRPYVQVRGDFATQLGEGMSIREDGADGRIVEGKLSVVIPNTCFTDPLPIMGVRKGKFTQDANPVIQFRLQNDGWHFDKLVH